MPMDGLMIHGLLSELSASLVGGRIDKVYQPLKDEVHLIIRSGNRSRRLLLSVNANHARMHWTECAKPNPDHPPLLCMVLRKHLVNGLITGLHQPEFDRIIQMDIENYDELGNRAARKLILEMMGRHSNLILINAQGRIIDSIKHIPGHLSRVREVLPGLDYTPPPSQGKADPSCLNAAQWQQAFAGIGGQEASQWLFDHYCGLSPVSCQLLAPWVERRSSEAMAKLFHASSIEPILYDNRDIFAHRLPGMEHACCAAYPSLEALADEYYTYIDQQKQLTTRCGEYERIIRGALDKVQRRHAQEQEKLNQCLEMDKIRLYGDLLTANLYQLQKGQRQAVLTNYEQPEGEPVLIELDNRLSPAQNAQRYYKKYSKLKTAYTLVTEQAVLSKREIAYLESLLLFLSRCNSIEQLQDIHDELVREGYKSEKKQGKPQKKPAAPLSLPHRYVSSDGFALLVGRNNLQNDQLTLQTAAQEDIWLHAKDIPGSHVIIRTEGKPVTDTTLCEACLLAAYHSTAWQSSNVPVDYTQRKYVKKPAGAKPGYVIYTHQHTLYVTPDKTEIGKIQLQNGES